MHYASYWRRTGLTSQQGLTDADDLFSFSNRLMGQANLVRSGRQFIAAGGSFTLTSGELSQEPIKGSASISMVNAGLEGFVLRRWSCRVGFG